MAPKSVTFRRHDHLVSVLWRFAQPFLHYIFNVLYLVCVVFQGADIVTNITFLYLVHLLFWSLP